MSEERFELSESIITDYKVYDNKQEDAYFISCPLYTAECLVELLNALVEENKEQADTIKHLEEYCGDLEHDNKTLQKEKQEWQDKALRYIKIMGAEFTETQLKRWSDKLM